MALCTLCMHFHNPGQCPPLPSTVRPNAGFPKTRWRVRLTPWGWRAEPYDRSAHNGSVSKTFHVRAWADAVGYADLMARFGRSWIS